jgi:hypothetical protein
MAKQNATTKQSSGGGFQFENQAVAYVITHLLTRSSPFDPPGGIVEQVEVQRPATEWHLDDLLVTVRAHKCRHRLAFSVRSNVQFSENRFPPDFIRAAWEQLLHDSSAVFDGGHDYLGLITAPVDNSLKSAVSELLGSARQQDPKSLAAQVGLPNRTNDTVRKLFRSAECPEDLAAKHGVEEGSSGRLLRRTVWSPFDFEDESSVQHARALELCQRLLRSGSADEAGNLWTSLKEVADRLRRFGGQIDLGRLVDEIRGRYELRDFPDHVPDWQSLSDDTRSAVGRVRSTIGGTVTLPRLLEHAAVSQEFANKRAVILLGASGLGKSVVAKSQAEDAMREGRALWLDAGRLRARTFPEWRGYLGLRHSLDEIMRATPAATALLVLDGLDQLYGEADLATAAEFVRAARLDTETSPWRVLITCTPEAWDRVQADLASHGGLPPDLGQVNVGPPIADELTAVWSAFPQLRPLRTRPHLAPILHRPKVLDLLATRASIGDGTAAVGESDLARWFWAHEVDYGPHAALRAAAALQLAQHFADKLVPDISASALSTAVETPNLLGLDELTESRVLRRVEGRIAFDHDLYADWVRVRQLVDVDEAGQLSAFIAPRLSSPVWHRALRLYGIHLLEHSADLAQWTVAFGTAGNIPGPVGALAQDILLESTAFASASGAGLLRESLWPLLAQHGGRLLERLLNRLFHTATFPNSAMVETVVRQAPELEIYATAGSRFPYPYYWFGILALLHAHREDVPAPARGVAARVADLWLRSTDQRWPFRKEAAELAVALGATMLREKEESCHLFYDGDDDQQVYRALLAAGHEQPEAVAQIVLEAAGRRQQRFAPPPFSEEELIALAEEHPEFPVPGLGRNRPPADPWPHGAAFRVDGALQKAALDNDGLRPLAEALPELAREVLMALLITPPRRRSFDDALDDKRFGLDSPRWYPALYTQGPFRSFLATAEPEAVTAILQLIDHATDRWGESTKRYLARNEGCSPAQVQTPMVPIEIDGQKVNFIGNADVFSWCHHGPDSGGVIGSALAALEKYLYDRVDSGADVTPLVLRLLRESRSLAIVGLLSVFARRHISYLCGPLRGFLVSPYLLNWTFMGSTHSMWQLSLSAVPAPLREEYRAWHEMPHRKASLHQIALLLFVNYPALRPLFEKAREELLTALQPGGPYEHWHFVENLVAQWDPTNYTEFEREDGITVAQYSPPEELRKKYAEREESNETRALLMDLPLQCRQLLDSPEPVLPQTLGELWAYARRISELEPVAGDDTVSPANALAGIAAVLVHRGREWLAEHPDQAEWVRRTLLGVAHEARGTEDLYRNLTWDRSAFAAETLPALWAGDPGDQDMRETVIRLALSESPELVGTITAGAAVVRERLGEDHLRLLHAVLLRAALEPRIRDAENRRRWGTTWNEIRPAPAVDRDDPAEVIHELRIEMRAIGQAFVKRTLKAAVPSLEEIAPLQPLGEQRAARRPHRRRTPYRLIEESLLTATYRGIPDPGDAGDHWLSVWERIVLDTVGPLAQANNETTEDLEDLPGPWDWGYYLMKRVADIVAVIEDPVTAQRLWKPIIDLGASASQWVRWFARSWTLYALSRDARESVVESWLAMIDAALANPHWRAGEGHTFLSHQTGELWRALLGIEHLHAEVWTEEIRPRVRLLKSRYARWAESHLANPRNVRRFARLLTLAAAADLMFDGIIWLDRESQALGDRFWRRRENDLVDDAVFSLLAHAWAVAREMLRRDESAFRGFRNLLQVLVSRQHAPALELADRVGSIGF